MRVILGYLLSEALDEPFVYDEALNERWISEIREYIPSEPLRAMAGQRHMSETTNPDVW